MPLSARLMRLLRLVRAACSFNALALMMLALQNASYLVLMGYAQQLQMAVPDDAAAEGGVAAAPSKKLNSFHFLALTEFIKLVISVVWFVVDEVLAMQKERSASATVPGDAAGLLAGGAARWRAEKSEVPGSLPEDPLGGEADLPTPVGFKPSSRYTGRHFGLLLLLRRMRHTIGLDRKYKETLFMVVPAITYAVQGLLVIHALKLLDPTMFQVLYEVRIIFTALMMRAVLDFHLSAVRWVALVALMMGITMTQLGKRREPSPAAAEQAEEGLEALKQWTLEGTVAALAGAFLSAFSGVFMEFVLKKRDNHFRFSARNVHITFFSVVYFAVAVFLRDLYAPNVASDATQRVREFCATFFDGFTGLVWFLVVLQAFGGLLVALVVRYGDNIVKSFSTAFAIVLNGTASVFLFDMPLSVPFVLGALLVMASIMVYSLRS